MAAQLHDVSPSTYPRGRRFLLQHRDGSLRGWVLGLAFVMMWALVAAGMAAGWRLAHELRTPTPPAPITQRWQVITSNHLLELTTRRTGHEVKYRLASPVLLEGAELVSLDAEQFIVTSVTLERVVTLHNVYIYTGSMSAHDAEWASIRTWVVTEGKD